MRSYRSVTTPRSHKNEEIIPVDIECYAVPDLNLPEFSDMYMAPISPHFVS